MADAFAPEVISTLPPPLDGWESVRVLLGESADAGRGPRYPSSAVLSAIRMSILITGSGAVADGDQEREDGAQGRDGGGIEAS